MMTVMILQTRNKFQKEEKREGEEGRGGERRGGERRGEIPSSLRPHRWNPERAQEYSLTYLLVQPEKKNGRRRRRKLGRVVIL